MATEYADRLGAAGIDKIGLGRLIGLDWRVDSVFGYAFKLLTTSLSRYSLSFPRLRPCAGSQVVQRSSVGAPYRLRMTLK